MATDFDDLQIESGIPIPASRSPIIDKLAKMKVGDSLFVPGGAAGGSVAGRAHMYGRSVTPKRKFKSMGIEGGCRLWRIK